MELTDKEINEIAENLDCGLRCFFNLKTREIKTVLNLDSWQSADEELWEDALKEIEDNSSDYFEFEGMSSRDSFNSMVDFIDTIDNLRLQERLTRALNKSKLFRNFKWEIDNSGDYRQKWFDYKKVRFIEWVKAQIEDFNTAKIQE